MSNSSVPEADGIKLTRQGESLAVQGISNWGVKPSFKRKRSFWRAYKRHECWAIMEAGTRYMLAKLNWELYGVQLKEENVIMDYHAKRGVIYLIRKSGILG